MRFALIIAIGVIGVLVTVAMAFRMVVAVRRGAPQQLVLGYLALMVLVTVASFLLMRVL